MTVLWSATLKWYQGELALKMTFDAASRILTSASGSTVTDLSFDNAGNQIGQNANGVLTTFIFDPENRLIQQQSAAGNSTYTYQATTASDDPPTNPPQA